MPLRPLAAKSIQGNLVTTRTSAWAWYKLAPQRWAWRSEGEREDLVRTAAAQLAQLTGHRVHVRVTSRPVAASQWADNLRAITPTPLPAFDEHVKRTEKHIADLALVDKEVYLGVEVSKKPLTLLAGLVSKKLEEQKLVEESRRIDRIVAGPGLEGRPTTVPELEWLLHRSCALGTTAPRLHGLATGWRDTDLAEVTGQVWWTAEPFDRTLKVTAEVDGDRVEHHVALMSLGRMGDLPLEPWLAKTDRLLYPVEMSVRMDVLDARTVTSQAQTAMMRIRNQVAHHEEHGIDPPWSLGRAHQRAMEVNDELEHSDEGLSARVDLWARISVAGKTEEEALARAHQIAELYQPTIQVVRPAGPYSLAWEFIPGERLQTPAYKRRMPVTTVAGGVPQTTAMVGQRQGSYIGYTSGTSLRPVSWDPWYAQEIRERSGTTAIIGQLGSGKTVLGAVIVLSSVLRGVRTTVLDPSGPLRRLTELPELAAHSRYIDLLHTKEPGLLNPFRLIAEPRPEEFENETEFEHAKHMVEGQRRNLCVDVLGMLLPASLAGDAMSLLALHEAARQVAHERWASPLMVLEALRDLEDPELRQIGKRISSFLDSMGATPGGSLIFPHAVERPRTDQPLLTVISMAGLQLPSDSTDPRHYSSEESLALPLLHLASHLATRAIYDAPMDERKLLMLDETWALARVGSGQHLLNRTARDSRKWNLRALYLSHSAHDFTSSDVAPLIDCTFVGRTEEPQAQTEALELCDVPRGAGFEHALASLSRHRRDAEGRLGSREFLWADGMGGVEKVRIDLGGWPEHVRRALDTTADPSSIRLRQVS